MTDIAPTPEETVVALLEQGHTPEQIIDDAEVTITEHEDAAGAVVFAAFEVAGGIEGATLAERAALAALTDFPPSDLERAQIILDQRLHPGRDVKVVRAVHKQRQAEDAVKIAESDAQAAALAAAHFCANADETVANAIARRAAAQDPSIVEPAVRRFQEIKKAEAAELQKAER